MSDKLRTMVLRILLFLICASQTLSANGTYAAVNAYKQRHTRVSVQVDYGVDTGIVKTVTTLFLEPSTNATKIGTLHKGALTVLVSREKSNGWLNVIQFTSGHQGWVRAERLVVHYTHHKAAGLKFRSEVMGTADPPEIDITNTSEKGIYLHLGTMSEMYVAPHATKKINVSADVYTFNVAAPDVLPDFGWCDFVTGGRYTWTFYISHVRQSKNQHRVSQALIDENKKLQADIDARTREVQIEKQQIDADRATLEQQQNKWKADSDEIETKRQMLDHSDQTAIDDFNNFVDAANNELAAIRQAEQRLNAEIEAYNSNLDFLNSKKHQLDEIADTINGRTR